MFPTRMHKPEVASGILLKDLNILLSESTSSLYRNKLETLLDKNNTHLANINEIFEIVTAFYKRNLTAKLE